MENRFIAFDVETPNAQNDRMSAIGITVVEDGRIVEEFYSLVDPEADFDWFNIQLTGITPEMVEGQPNFGGLWETIGPIMDSGLLIAHNAPFDMGVLGKCLRRYDIDWHPTVHYACTCRMGRACLPFLPNHKLNTLCDYLGITLDHHNAGSDSRACAQLLQYYLEEDLALEKFRRTYDLTCCRTLQRR